MSPEALLSENLVLVDRIVLRVCRRANLQEADVADFASSVKLALIEKDYAVLRSYEGRAPLAAFLAVFIQRMLVDEYFRERGRWRPSAEARRHGQAGVMIETLVCRDRRPIDEVLPIVRAFDPGLTRARVEELVAAMPEHTRKPRAVELEAASEAVSMESADARVLQSEELRAGERAAAVPRDVMSAFTAEDRMILRFRFFDGVSVSDIARMTRLPQRPLYRRIESLLARLRAALAAAGIAPGDLPERFELDVGLRRETGSAKQTSIEADLH